MKVLIGTELLWNSDDVWFLLAFIVEMMEVFISFGQLRIRRKPNEYVKHASRHFLSEPRPWYRLI